GEFGAPAFAHSGRHKILLFAGHAGFTTSLSTMLMLRSTAPLRRLLVVLLLLLAGSAPAMALSVMDPFNLGTAMDGGTVKAGDGIAYADGPRHRLDVYAPEARGAAAPVVFFIYGGGWNRGERS